VLPLWLRSAPAHEIVNVPDSAPSASAGLAPAVSGTMGSQSGLVDAWGGAFVYAGKYHIHGGGHTDYGGNEIGVIDLAQNVPAWDLLVERTPVADLLGGSNYYADGNPTSRHTYYAMFVATVGSVPRMYRLNANMGFAYNGTPVGGSADVRTEDIDGFRLDTNAWEPAAYGPMPRITGSETGAAQHPTTGDIYVWNENNIVSVYDVSADSASDVVDMTGTEGQGGAVVVDAVNDRIVRFAGRASGGVVYYPLSGGSKTSPTLTGSGASSLTTAMSGTQPGWGIAHDTLRNVVYLYSLTPTIYRVDVSTWEVEEITPTGETLDAPTNGWWGRVKYVPELDVVVSLASWSSEVQALKCGD